MELITESVHDEEVETELFIGRPKKRMNWELKPAT